MAQRSASAAATPLAESIAKVVSRNQSGMPAATSEKRRIGSVARTKIHHCRGGLSNKAQSRTESGNQNVEVW